MKTYAIGDVHGCFDTLEQLLQQIPNKSRLVFIGDIVNRGPKSLETIRTVTVSYTHLTLPTTERV